MKRRMWGCVLVILILCGCSREPAVADGEENQTVTEVQTAEEIREKQEIVLVATDQIENMLAGFITEYNQQSENYYITYEDLFDQAAGYDSMVTRLNARLVSGNCPDLVIINYNFFQTYLEAEALEDLTPYLLQSQVIDREDYLDKIIAPFEKEDGLYGIPRSFLLQTLLVRSMQEPESQGWSIEEFLEYLETHPETAFEWERSSFEVLKYCLQYGIDAYVDYETGECFFDGEEFAALLRRIKELSKEDAELVQIRQESAENGGILLMESIIGSFMDIDRMEIRYEGNVTHMGYPSIDGTLQCRLLPQYAIGLCANGKNKEAAWDIAEQYLKYQFDLYDFPAEREAFEATLSKKTTVQYTTGEDGSEIELPVEYYYGEPIYALTQEQAATMLEAVEAATVDDVVREDIRDFVLEEAVEYFWDRKTLEEVQQTIQSRVQLYLAERR